MMEYQDHQMTFKTDELAGILSCILATLSEDQPYGFEALNNALVSVAEKISVELGMSPINVPDPVHIT